MSSVSVATKKDQRIADHRYNTLFLIHEEKSIQDIVQI